MDEILQEKDYVAAQKDIKTLGQNHVYFLPYLMGERSPHNDPLARACFMGMTMDTGRADMIQAVFEGVAFAMRDSLEVARSQGIDIKRTKICGGGAKSPLWCKIMANVLNLQVDLLEVEEGPGAGRCHTGSRRLRCLRIRRRSGRCDRARSRYDLTGAGIGGGIRETLCDLPPDLPCIKGDFSSSLILYNNHSPLS